MKKIYLLLTGILPRVTMAAYKLEKPSGIGDALIEPTGDPVTAVTTYVVGVGNNLLLFVGGLAVLGITIGGLQLVINMGNEDGQGKAKSTIKYSLMGLVIALLAWVIVNTVVSGMFTVLDGGSSSGGAV